MARLDGKIAIISGAASGMGASHARMFAAEGAKVVLTDIAEEAGISLAEALGPAAAFIRHDVSSAEDWDAVVSFAEQRFGPVSILVNNAGMALETPITELRDSDYDRVMAVNSRGAFLGCRAVVPSMRTAGGGSIVNISSVAGLKGYANAAAYCTSKFAIRGLTKALAMELAAEGIRVNSVHPGLVRTPMIKGMDVPDAVLQVVPIKRIGEPHEISYLVLFLASDESSFCVGAEFVADGGLSAM